MRPLLVVLGLWVAGVVLLAVVGGLVSWLWSVDPWAVGALVVAAVLLDSGRATGHPSHRS